MKTLKALNKLLEREKNAKLICAELNNFVDLKSVLQTIITFVKKLTGCQAVGIRLHDDGEYPYYVYDGFPDSFILQENSLCVRDSCGNRVHSPDGNGYLVECMCGNIICGRYDPAQPFFTEKGSFWSNCTSDLLASTDENNCKRIRDDGGYWQAVEVYIKNHSKAEFSHSLCDTCLRELYPESVVEN